MNLKSLFNPLLIPLLAALIGIALGFWTIWPEQEMPDNFEELIRIPLAEDGTDQ